MTKKIFRSVFASCMLVAAMTVGLIVIILNNYFVSIEETQIAAQAELTCAGINAAGQDYIDDLNIDGYRLTWIDKDGTVKYDSQVDAASMVNHGDREEVQEAILKGTGMSTRNSSTLATDTMYYAKRCDDGTVVRLSIERNSALFLLLRLLTPLLWILLAAVCVAYIMGKRTANKVSELLNRLDLDHPLCNVEVDEIQPLMERLDKQNAQITEQLESLHQKKKEFETATSSMREGLILINTKWKILSQNPTAEALFHLDSNDQNAFKNLDADLLKIIDTALHGKQNSGVITLDNKPIKVEASPITSRGNLIGVSILVYDVSEEYAAEVQRREFTANVSHELKTPLQTIMGAAELLQNHMVKKEDEADFLGRIQKESARLLSLIDDIIRLSQLDENQKMEEDKLNLTDTVQEVFDSLHKSAEKHHVTIHLNTKDAYVYANNRLLYEIAYNLLDNAIRYNHDPGSVTIETYNKNQVSYLVVSDTGIGVPKEAQARIFERFYRVDKSHSRSTGGTGLGLSIVKHAIAICGGKVEIQSIEGEGTTFIVSIPDKEVK